MTFLPHQHNDPDDNAITTLSPTTTSSPKTTSSPTTTSSPEEKRRRRKKLVKEIADIVGHDSGQITGEYNISLVPLTD